MAEDTVPVSAHTTAVSSAGRQWAAWQLLDSLLPTGGFAHSQGLEAAAQAGLVEASADSVGHFCRLALHNTASMALPHVQAALDATAALATTPSDPGVAGQVVSRVSELDSALHCQLAGNHVAQRASEALGASLLRASSAAFGDDSVAVQRLLTGLKALYRRQPGGEQPNRTSCHQVPVTTCYNFSP